MTVVRFEPLADESEIVTHNGTVYLSGQTSREPANDVAGQTAAILKKIDALLAHAGTGKERILSAMICLANGATHEEFRLAWDAWIPPAQFPARSLFEATPIEPGCLVQITVTAAKSYHG